MNRRIFSTIFSLAIIAVLVGGIGTVRGESVFGGDNPTVVGSEDDLFFGDVGRSSTSRPALILNTDLRIATSTGASTINQTRFFLDIASSTLSGIEIRRTASGTFNFIEAQNQSGSLLMYVDYLGNIFSSGSVSSAGTTSTGHLVPATNNTYDIGRPGFAWRDLYASGSLFSSAFDLRSTSATIFSTDIPGSNNLRSPALIEYRANQAPTFALENALRVQASSSAQNGSQLYQPAAASFDFIYAGLVGSNSVQIDGGVFTASLHPGLGGEVNRLRGISGAANIATVSNVSSTIGVAGSLSFAAAGAGSVFGTSTGIFGSLSPSVMASYRDIIIGTHGRVLPTAGDIPLAAAIFGEANTYASTSIAGFFAGTLWVDADSRPDVSAHGVSNTPGSAFIGDLFEVKGTAWFDGSLRASSTAMITGVTTAANILPWTNNAYDIGAYGSAWGSIYASNSIVIGTAAQNLIISPSGDFPIQPSPNNTLDIGGYSFAFRDLYTSGTLYGDSGLFASTSLVFNDFQSVSQRAGIRVWPNISGNVAVSNDNGIFIQIDASSTPASGYTIMGTRSIVNWSGYQSANVINLTGLQGIARTAPGVGGLITLQQGVIGNGFLAASSTVAQLIGVAGSLTVDAAAAGSYVTTGSPFAQILNLSQNATFNRVHGVNSIVAGTGGQIFTAIGVYGRASYGSSTFAGYFAGAPLWIDADDSADVSNHGASNTPGALFVGALAEMNSDLFVDGPFHASGTAMFTLGVTSSHIYPWINNTYDLGAYGSAWGNVFVSGTTRLSGPVVLGDLAADDISVLGNFATGLTPNANDSFDLGGWGAAWNNVYTSGSIYFGTSIAGEGNLLPNVNNTSNLGAFGAAMMNLFASSTSYLGSVTTTQITPWANDSFDLGAYGNAWRTLYASTSVIIGSTVTLNSSALLPGTNGAFSLGAYGTALNNVFVSGTARFDRLLISSDNTPTLEACGAAATVAAGSNDQTGKINVGSGGVTNCTLVFATAWGTAPSCSVISNNLRTFRSSSTVSSFGFGLTGDMGNDVAMYQCSSSN